MSVPQPSSTNNTATPTTNPTRQTPNYNPPNPQDLHHLTHPPTGLWTLHQSITSTNSPEEPITTTTTGETSSLSRTFTFPTFTKAWTFMTAIAEASTRHRHHPEWSNTYNRVFVRWTTHKVGGKVTVVDLEMARICDGVARGFGEIGGGGDGGGKVREEKSGQLKRLADMNAEGCEACATGKIVGLNG